MIHEDCHFSTEVLIYFLLLFHFPYVIFLCLIFFLQPTFCFQTEYNQNLKVHKPLFRILVTQPHMFYSQFSRSCSIQVILHSCILEYTFKQQMCTVNF